MPIGPRGERLPYTNDTLTLDAMTGGRPMVRRPNAGRQTAGRQSFMGGRLGPALQRLVGNSTTLADIVRGRVARGGSGGRRTPNMGGGFGTPVTAPGLKTGGGFGGGVSFDSANPGMQTGGGFRTPGIVGNNTAFRDTIAPPMRPAAPRLSDPMRPGPRISTPMRPTLGGF